MGFFDNLFGKVKPQQQHVNNVAEFLKTLTMYAPSFTTFSGGIYETELVRSVVHAKAKHTAKLTPHIVGSKMKTFENVLRNQPNEFQSTYDFLYRLRMLYEVDTHAFIIPVLSDDEMRIVGLYPLQAKQVEILDYKGTVFLRYKFANGEAAVIEYDRVGVLTKLNYKNEFLGDGNGVLSDTMSLLDLQNQGIQEAIKQSAQIRFMAQIGQNLRPEDLEKERQNFSRQNLEANTTGVMMFDTKYNEVKQIDSKPFVADEKQINLINNNVYSYFGVNEAILQNKFDENEWNAFYEGEIEPFAIQLSQAITNMLFTQREKAQGNAVHFSANRLQYASNTTKLEVSRALFDRGIFGVNDLAEIWNLPLQEENKRYLRKEYAEMIEVDDETVTQIELDNAVNEEIAKGENDDN